MAEPPGRPPRALRVLITGGGTGGHLFPGLAIAEALGRLAPDADIRFAGSHYGIESRVVPARGYRLYRLPVRGLYGVSLPRRLWALALMPLALLQALGLLLWFRPQLVVGVGGYASGPVLALAVLLRRPTAIQEQNAAPGVTNRLLGRYVSVAFAPSPELRSVFPRLEVVGNPVRREILALRDTPPTVRPEGETPLLFVFGGSQGARAINRALTEALPALAAWGRPLEILHQAGAADLDWVAAAYRDSPLPHRVTPFIDDMAAALGRARIVVSRAGASAVSEIATAGRASVLIPIPHTSGDHQLMNARRLAEAGAAVLIEQHELTGGVLAGALMALLGQPQRLDAMERATAALHPGDAAATIARRCLALLGREPAPDVDADAEQPALR